MLPIFLLLVAGCHPPVAGDRSPPAVTTSSPVAATPPGGHNISAPGYQVTSINPPRSATLASQNSQAQINLRSQPSLQAEVVAQGRSGDSIQLLSLTEAEGGYTWYYGQLGQASRTGWVRGDMVKVGGPMPTPATAAGSPAQPCGSDRQEAAFETRSFAIHICNAQGKLRYLSTDKTTQAGIVIQTVIHNQGTYIAIDGDRQYHVNNQSLGVYQVNNGNYSQLAAEKVLKSQ